MTTGFQKVWTGSAWACKPVKVWNGSAWVGQPVKVWSGSAWVVKSCLFAPVNSVVPAITGTPTEGQTLTASTGTWSGSPTSYAYQWKRGGTAIGSATASTYLLVTADVGSVITVTVTATNAAGSAAATSAGTSAVIPLVSYAVWDTATTTAVTLSGSNLVATNTGTTSTSQGAHVAATSGKTTGKYYFEFTITTFTGGAGVGIGIGTTASIYSDMSTFSTHGDMLFLVGHTGGGPLWTDTSNTGYTVGARSTGNVIGVAVDLDARRACFRVGATGTWNGSANSTVGTNGLIIPAGTIVPFVTFGSSFSGAAGVAGNVITANFGASAFTGAVPSGYTSGWPA